MRASARVGAKCYNKWERRCFSGLGIFGTFLGQLFHRLPSPARATPPKNRFQARTSSSSAPFKRSPRVTFARPRSQARLPITQHRPRTAASATAAMGPSLVTALAAADKRDRAPHIRARRAVASPWSTPLTGATTTTSSTASTAFIGPSSTRS